MVWFWQDAAMPAGEGPVDSFELAMLAARRAAEIAAGGGAGAVTTGSAGVGGGVGLLLLSLGKPALRSACVVGARRRDEVVEGSF